jgi:2-oxoglutarate dehydrogenase E2 component (dihydrolipoamide succinyltransferase)
VAKRLAEDQGVDLTQVPPSGPGGRATKQDVQVYLEQQKIAEARPAPPQGVVEPPRPAIPSLVQPTFAVERQTREERVRLSRRRQTIARRLVEAQHTAAMLTTFNEIDMSAVADLRKRRKESFVERHGVNLGLMSFFVKATIGALKTFPQLNAEIQGDEVILKYYYDIGIAVGAAEGLVVPVLRDADRMSFAQIEKTIKEFVRKSEEGSLTLEDLRGGTFTITNGGVFGSLLSTPILNPPQVGILGLHKIEERPVVLRGEIVVRTMMYVALSYDHRIVDGREAVQFLVRLKELVEDPEALLLEG